MTEVQKYAIAAFRRMMAESRAMREARRKQPRP